jgi:microcystin-dependent protein
MPLPIDNYQASLALTQLFPQQGVFPTRDSTGDSGPFPLGSIRTFAGNFAMGGQGAEGQVIPIGLNTALFSLLGNMYGGDGTANFALPNLDGRTMIGGAPLEYFGRPPIGSSGITLSSGQLPASLGGSSDFIDNYQPSQPVTYLIREAGIFPSPGSGGGIDMMGEIVPFAGNFVPGGYLEAAGQLLQIADHETLFQLIGTTYGGDGATTFQLPDLRNRTIVGTSAQLPIGATEGQAEAALFNGNLPVSVGGSGLPFDNHEPSLALTYLISLTGIFPSHDGGVPDGEQILGEVMAFAGDFAPKGWAKAEGQLLSISQNQALFSLLGTMYGGDGRTTFALPDLRGRTVIGTGDIAHAGDVFGSNAATVLSSNIPDVHVTGTSDPNTLHGADGNDFLDGAGGADTMIGGLGNDTYTVDNIGDVVSENPAAGSDTVLTGLASYTLPANVENLTGTSATGQVLTGNALDNVIAGGIGADLMTGGTGNDTYVVNNSGDAVIENPAEGTDTVQSSVHNQLAPNVENLVLTGNADLQGYGNDLANTLTGNSGNNLLDGGANADVMIGGLGNDTYFVDNIGDAVVENANEGTDAIFASINLGLSANVEVLVLQGSADLQGYGNALANTLNGNTGNNLLDGGAGADRMVGGGGNDTYFVDDPGDVVVENAGQGTDAVFASVSRTMGVNLETLVLQGSADLQGYGNGAANTLFGNTGNNLLDGRASADRMVGGAGDDTYFVDDAGDLVVENAGQGSDAVFSTVNYRLSANVETLVLQGSADLQGYGNGLVNALYGNTGNNLLDGGGGADTMAGGAGDDTYFVDNALDTVVENPGEGNDAVFATANVGLSANVETLVLQGSADLQGFGNDLANAIYGNSGNNLLDGGVGADLMVGGAGNDTYFVDNASDATFESPGEGTDAVFSTAHYGLAADVEILVLQGSADLQGYGSNQANTLYGNTGNNLLNGAGGADMMYGGVGNDTYFVDDGLDQVIENPGEGTDAIFTTAHFVLSANVETLVQQGSADLGGTGNALANSIVGNSGNNTLDGQGDADTLTGNAGNDTFVFNVGQANGDTVVDFAGNGAAAGDSLEFVGFGTAVQGATFTQVGATNQWQIHSGLDAHNEVITLMNGALIDPSDVLFV